MRPQIIFVHGMWCRPSVWAQWQGEFEAADYPCTSIALPGHAEGDPDSALENKGIDDYVDAVAKIAAQFERPVVVGHSMGGFIAQKLASRGILRAAVLVNSATPAPVFPLRAKMLPFTTRPFLTWGLWRKSFRILRREADYLVFNKMPETGRAELFGQLIAESGRVAYQLGFGPLNLAGSNRVDRDAINCPMLFLAGAQDNIIPVGASRSMAAWYGKRLDYREYSEHGHWMLDEPGWKDRVADSLAWLEPVCA
jgi:pimeloyl-ACP methyl ester carboxylesterase